MMAKIYVTLLGIILLSSYGANAMPGDVNGNGIITHVDRLLIQDHILNLALLENDALTRADSNQDGKINVADLVYMHSIYTLPEIEMVNVPVGTFTMGARDDGDDGEHAADDEYPRHQVTLSAYQMGKYEVTNGQYSEVLNYALSRGYLENSDGNPYNGEQFVYYNSEGLLYVDYPDCQVSYTGDSFTWDNRDGYSMENHPVVMVSWFGAVAFCNFLSEMSGFKPAYDLSTWELVDQFGGGYRLPTEAEWERAAAWDSSSAGKHWIYGCTSDAASFDRMNYLYHNPLGLSNEPYTTPAGYYNGAGSTLDSPSPAGCYDMSGNVNEWCHGWYKEDYYKESPSINPTGAASGNLRVVRGGHWKRLDFHCRTAKRDRNTPANTCDTVGFRVVLRSSGR